VCGVKAQLCGDSVYSHHRLKKTKVFPNSADNLSRGKWTSLEFAGLIALNSVFGGSSHCQRIGAEKWLMG